MILLVLIFCIIGGWHFSPFNGSLELQAVDFHISCATKTHNTAGAADTDHAELVTTAGVGLLERQDHVGKELDDLHSCTLLKEILISFSITHFAR